MVVPVRKYVRVKPDVRFDGMELQCGKARFDHVLKQQDYPCYGMPRSKNGLA